MITGQLSVIGVIKTNLSWELWPHSVTLRLYHILKSHKPQIWLSTAAAGSRGCQIVSIQTTVSRRKRSRALTIFIKLWMCCSSWHRVTSPPRIRGLMAGVTTSRTQAGARQTSHSVGSPLRAILRTLGHAARALAMTCPMSGWWPGPSPRETTPTRGSARWWCSSASFSITTSAPPASRRRDAVWTPADRSASTLTSRSQTPRSRCGRTRACPASTLPGRDQLAVSLGGSRSTQSPPSLTAATSTAARRTWAATWGPGWAAGWWRATRGRVTCQPRSSSDRPRIT